MVPSIPRIWLPKVRNSGSKSSLLRPILWDSSVRCSIPTSTLPTTKLDTPICKDLDRINLENLVPGAELTTTRQVGADSGSPPNSGDSSPTRVGPIAATAASFKIPDDGSPDDPKGTVSFQKSQSGTSGCSLRSDSSDPLLVVDTRAGIWPKPAFSCPEYVVASDLIVGSKLQYSHADEPALLPDGMPVIESSMVLTY